MTLCIICLESRYNCKSVSIRDINYVTKHQDCECDYMIHESCLIEWLKFKNVCLICHGEIIYDDTNTTLDVITLVCCILFNTLFMSILFAMTTIILVLLTYICIKIGFAIESVL